jgi:lysozyme
VVAVPSAALAGLDEKGKAMTLLDQLVRDEGVRLFPYVDTVGKITIGIGRNLSDGGISRQEAIQLLANDVENAAAHLQRALPWTQGLDDVRHAALVNMTFNMGIGRLCDFTKMIAALRVEDWKTARNEMLDSQWAKQVGARAQRLAIQIETGVWQ